MYSMIKETEPLKYDAELNDFLCLIDGKITAYRMKQLNINPSLELYNKNKKHIKLLQIQTDIQKLWDLNQRGRL